MTKYAYEGSNGGYPLEDDEWDAWYSDMIQRHECCACDHFWHEDDMVRTTDGWMCKECWDYISNLDETDKPELI